jgi:hypothetical protein
MVNTGFRLVIGSWKIIATSLPRKRRICGSGSFEQVNRLARPVDEQGLPLTCVLAVRGQQAHERQAGHRLAGARLADDGRGLACADVEAHVGHGADQPFVGVEGGAQVAHFEAIHGVRLTSIS